MHIQRDHKPERLAQFAAQYRGLQQEISTLTGEPQPPCCGCTDLQIWNCSNTGHECVSFSRYYTAV